LAKILHQKKLKMYFRNSSIDSHHFFYTQQVKMSDIEMTDAAVPISPSQQIAAEVNEASEAAAAKSDVLVSKPIPYVFDLGHLLVNDENPIPSNPSQELLDSTARDCAQALVNQLLTTCEINSTDAGVDILLPEPTTPLPREKPVPKPKEATKWEKFALKKGIRAKKREDNKVYDEATGEWVPRWGFRGANRKGENDWLVEVDPEKEAKTGKASDPRKEKRADRLDRIKRQDRKMRSNQARGSKALKT
jgi:regulator of ribosome biosynthesis